MQNVLRTWQEHSYCSVSTSLLLCQSTLIVPSKISFFLRSSTWKESSWYFYSSILSLLISFTVCSESSLRSHLLLQQLDSFENVLENLVERYYDICYNELNISSKLTEHYNNQHNRKTNNNNDNHTYEQLIQGKKKNNSRENNAEEGSVPAYNSQQEKVKYLCTFLLSSIDSNSSSSSVDSEYFFLRCVFNMMVSCCICCKLIYSSHHFFKLYCCTEDNSYWSE